MANGVHYVSQLKGNVCDIKLYGQELILTKVESH